MKYVLGVVLLATGASIWLMNIASDYEFRAYELKAKRLASQGCVVVGEAGVVTIMDDGTRIDGQAWLCDRRRKGAL